MSSKNGKYKTIVNTNDLPQNIRDAILSGAHTVLNSISPGFHPKYEIARYCKEFAFGSAAGGSFRGTKSKIGSKVKSSLQRFGVHVSPNVVKLTIRANKKCTDKFNELAAASEEVRRNGSDVYARLHNAAGSASSSGSSSKKKSKTSAKRKNVAWSDEESQPSRRQPKKTAPVEVDNSHRSATSGALGFRGPVDPGACRFIPGLRSRQCGHSKCADTRSGSRASARGAAPVNAPFQGAEGTMFGVYHSQAKNDASLQHALNQAGVHGKEKAEIEKEAKVFDDVYSRLDSANYFPRYKMPEVRVGSVGSVSNLRTTGLDSAGGLIGDQVSALVRQRLDPFEFDPGSTYTINNAGIPLFKIAARVYKTCGVILDSTRPNVWTHGLRISPCWAATYANVTAVATGIYTWGSYAGLPELSSRTDIIAYLPEGIAADATLNMPLGGDNNPGLGFTYNFSPFREVTPPPNTFETTVELNGCVQVPDVEHERSLRIIWKDGRLPAAKNWFTPTQTPTSIGDYTGSTVYIQDKMNFASGIVTPDMEVVFAVTAVVCYDKWYDQVNGPTRVLPEYDASQARAGGLEHHAHFVPTFVERMKLLFEAGEEFESTDSSDVESDAGLSLSSLDVSAAALASSGLPDAEFKLGPETLGLKHAWSTIRTALDNMGCSLPKAQGIVEIMHRDLWHAESKQHVFDKNQNYEWRTFAENLMTHFYLAHDDLSNVVPHMFGFQEPATIVSPVVSALTNPNAMNDVFIYRNVLRIGAEIGAQIDPNSKHFDKALQGAINDFFGKFVNTSGVADQIANFVVDTVPTALGVSRYADAGDDLVKSLTGRSLKKDVKGMIKAGVGFL